MHITYNLDANFYRSWSKFQSRSGFLATLGVYDGLRKLSTLPLTSAGISFRTSQYQSEVGLWTKFEREELADSLQIVLLNPRGAEVYAEAQQKLKEESKRQRQLELKARESRTRLLRPG